MELPTDLKMTSGSRTPSWKERENNKKRERRRRAIAAKIFTGLRMYGKYKLPKHCDNNEVLKALCDEAGWTVELDGTTYRKGCKPPERMNINGGGSASASPTSSSFPSPSSSSYAPPPLPNGTSLIPWLKNLSSSNKFSHTNIHGGSISAPVTSPLNSPRIMTNNWDQTSFLLHSSTPPSPNRVPQIIPSSDNWLSGVRPINSPTFSFVSSNPFEFKDVVTVGSGSGPMWTPGQSGTCSPVVRMGEVISDEFAFGCNMKGVGVGHDGLVKPWEGEMIHEEFGADDLELTLTLGCSKTR